MVLAFYPFNWQEATAAQLVSYQLQRPRMLAGNAEIVTITVDSIMNTTAWERAIRSFRLSHVQRFLAARRSFRTLRGLL